MGINVNDIAITSLETITAFDIVSGEYMFTLDELQSATIANSEDKEDITGKQGRKLTSLKRNKTVTVSGNNGLLSSGLLALQVGGTFEERTTEVMYPDYITVTKTDENCTATTTYKATGTAGNEIGGIYVRNADGTLGTYLTQDSTATDSTFTYDPETKIISLDKNVAENGQTIIAHYFRTIKANVLDNLSDNFSEKAALYIDAFGEDTCGLVYRIQFFVPKADFSGTFDMQLGDGQTVHAFEAESLVSNCGTKGSLWTYTVYGEDTEDIA